MKQCCTPPKIKDHFQEISYSTQLATTVDYKHSWKCSMAYRHAYSTSDMHWINIMYTVRPHHECWPSSDDTSEQSWPSEPQGSDCVQTPRVQQRVVDWGRRENRAPSSLDRGPAPHRDEWRGHGQTLHPLRAGTTWWLWNGVQCGTQWGSIWGELRWPM